MQTYDEWCKAKLEHVLDAHPVPHGPLHEGLFPFQRQIVEWALALGRAAVWAECGLGKSRIQLEWARWVATYTGARVLIFAPLAVAPQTVAEGAAMGLDVYHVREPSDIDTTPPNAVLITNYERLERMPVESMGGVVLDESSILKSFMGKTKRELVSRCAAVNYRLALTATPAPNDHLEIGNHAEFLGVMVSSDMIARWFINDTSLFGTYRLKGHAVESFWDWVGSWAVCCAVPSDLGHSDEGYVLPPLRTIPEWVEVDVTEGAGAQLFRIPDTSATGIHREKRLTAGARADRVASIVAREPEHQWVVWCETDYEADAITARIPDAIEVRGSMTEAKKEAAAADFAAGRVRVLVTKSSIFGFGLNWQHCARQAFVGATWSYESFYQAIRRSWRFGQKNAVDAYVCMASTEGAVWKVLEAKRVAHDTMRDAMSAAMRRAQSRASSRRKYVATVDSKIPAWLQSEVQS